MTNNNLKSTEFNYSNKILDNEKRFYTELVDIKFKLNDK